MVAVVRLYEIKIQKNKNLVNRMFTRFLFGTNGQF